ncbi:VOC family protein [Salmonella enterica]|nr:VOC family protein [Salmonella enterica]EBQ1580171.1 VOC family protein [Salmonella enterica]
MLIKGIDHVVITVQDVQKTLDFYVNGLEMKLDDSHGRLAVTFGCQKINIHRKKAEFKPAAKNVTAGSMDLCFVIEGDIYQIKSLLEEKGLRTELGVVPRTGARGPMKSIYLRDPDGNLVEICVYQ